MKRLLMMTAMAVAALWIPTSGSDTPLDAAALAWERGDYVAALTSYLRVLDSPDGEAALEPIALQTGELFHTTELTTDGAAAALSRDGRHVTYETGLGLDKRTRLIRSTEPGTPLAVLQGSGAVFSPDGSKLAYVKLTPSEELLRLQAALDAAPQPERQQRQAAVTQRIALEGQIVVRDTATGTETALDTGAIRKASILASNTGTVYFAGSVAEGPTQVYAVSPGQPALALTTGDLEKTPLTINSSSSALLYTVRAPGGGRGGRGGAGGGQVQGGQPAAAPTPATFGIISLSDGRATSVPGTTPSFSGDGGSFTYIHREADENRVMVASIANPSAGAIARKGPERVDAPALSADGTRVVFQMMAKEDWEIFTVNRDGSGEARISREIQHDIAPRFLSDSQLIAAIGEARHRRSYLYDLPSGKRTRLFHNNTVRTIAPEYAWVPSADGTKVLITAERDGDTVSTERGVYLVDLTRRVTADELRKRLRANLASEEALRARGTRIYAPIAAAVKAVVSNASVDRVYSYEKALFDFDSKHITRPGNKLASAYLFDKYKSFGYQPEYQWFAGRGALGGQTANVLATLKGTVNPELVYVVSSHYDSVAVGPGADDDTSGTAALLEAARIMAAHPQPATIVFASFTGEEAGLLGSREYVRRAVADKVRIVGALNNDMVGWANDQRLDNTIRYSNAGIRDIQHAAAMQFTNMITYDALYYKSTDAAAYYEAFGDIVGGIGSYPVLGNPHYHQSHDLLDTINHQLVTEVAKTTAATLMLLASSPSRLTDLKVNTFTNGTATLSWAPSPEKGVTAYIVAYGPAANPEAQQIKVTGPAATLKGLAPGTVISVKAINAKGLEGWDWARVTVR